MAIGPTQTPTPTVSIACRSHLGSIPDLVQTHALAAAESPNEDDATQRSTALDPAEARSADPLESTDADR